MLKVSRSKLGLVAMTCVPLLGACNASGQKDAARRAEVVTALKQHLTASVTAWVAASHALQAAAPDGLAGWNVQTDAAAIAAMKKEWKNGRRAYELVEGAMAPLFPESDVATDSRYEDFLVREGSVADKYSFDGEGVVGMHAIERILWADTIPEAVVAYESALPGYTKAAFPTTAAEAADFKNKLVARLVKDTENLQAQLASIAPDIAFVYRGLLDLVREQVEKVDKTASGEEESRYAQSTLADLRSNLDGCEQAYAILRPWLREKSEGPAVDARITAAFAELRTLYGTETAMPSPPDQWSSLDPTPAALATPFGKLFASTKHAADEKAPGSLVAQLRIAAKTLGLPEMP